MLATPKYQCPVCHAFHFAQPQRVAGILTLACDQVTPAGSTRTFQLWNPPVIVIGAGLGVTERPPEQETETQRIERMARMENEINQRKLEIANAEREKQLKKDYARVEAEHAKIVGGQA